MIIKYNSVIINGVDKTGQVEDIDDKEALTMIKLGYAVQVNETPVENYFDQHPRHSEFAEPERKKDTKKKQ